MKYKEKYLQWLNSEIIDDKTKEELKKIEGNDKEIEERFYKDLEFGTAGLRGIIGAGSNRMNIYTIGLATQGLANYILKQSAFAREKGVAIAYDSRHMSPEFAEQASLVLNGNGIKTYLFESLRPTPELSFAVRELGCIAGIVITASHNPPEYNGYKVYWQEGYQLIPDIAKKVIDEAKKLNDFSLIKNINKEEALEKGLLEYIGDNIDELYISEVVKQSLNGDDILKVTDHFKIVFTPIHGAGNELVRQALAKVGFKNVFVVEEQEKPDPSFSTVKVPNPENVETFELAIKLAKEKQAHIIIATDPDADRVGVAYRNKNGDYINLNGNQIGALLVHYVLNSLKQKGKLPDNGILIKSIVSSELSTEIAKSFDVEMLNTLTGFKYIGEKIEEFESIKIKKFILGFEESYGYLVGTHARDKDAVVTSMLLCEMAAYYYKQGKNLGEAMNQIYQSYGYFLEDLESIKLDGKEGSMKIQKISNYFRRQCPLNWAGIRVNSIEDYLLCKRSYIGEGKVEEIHLPKSDVIKVNLNDGSWFCIRPSGTEPKIKIYFAVKAESFASAIEKLSKIKEEVLLNVAKAQCPNAK